MRPWLSVLNKVFFVFCWVSLLLGRLTGLFRFLFERGGDRRIGMHRWQLRTPLLLVKLGVLGAPLLDARNWIVEGHIDG